MDVSIFEKYNIDYKKGIDRCLNDEGVFRQILELFLEDDTFNRAKKAYDEEDYKELFSCIHELKGVSGNASLTELFSATSKLANYLRDGKVISAEVNKLFAFVEAAYTHVREGISLALFN